MSEPAFLRSGWVLATGLRLGLLGRVEAIRWADHWAAQLDPLPDGLWDLSMPAPAADLLSLVTAMVGRAGPRDGFAIVVGLLGRAHARGAIPIVTAVNELAAWARGCIEEIGGDAYDRAQQLEYAGELVEVDDRDVHELVADFEAFARPFEETWADELAIVTPARSQQ